MAFRIIPEKERDQPSYWDLIIISLAALICGLGMVIAAHFIGLINILRLSPVDTATVIALQSIGFVVGICLYGRGFRRLTWASMGLKPVPPRAILDAVLLGIIVYTVALFVIAFLAPGAEEAMRDIFARGHVTIPGAVAAVIAASFFAPFAEELWFRGVLFRGLRPRWGFWAAALVSSVLFGLMHFQTGLLIWPITSFVLGLLLARLTEIYDSILPAVAFHAVYNFIGMSTIMRSAING